MGYDGLQIMIDAQPNKSLRELVQREETRHSGKQQLTPMLHLGQRRHPDDAKNGAADKIGTS
jgi:hypothetical protein